MQRTKVLAMVGALLLASVSAILLLGGASAASWHVYQGDVHAGHAYGLQVPIDAESIEFTFDGAESGAASIAVYTPKGERVGHYALSEALTTASIANPVPGQYALYVYDITDGALSVRVASEDEPALELESVPLSREETTIGTFEQGKLDQVITATLPREAVFVTLLYEGSARGLDATVASEKGDVVTIVDESATAFSPGVWTTIKGERTFDAANLEGTGYTVTVHADDFEGTMVLTTLALELPKMPTTTFTPPEPGTPPTPPQPPAPPRVPEGSPFVPSPAAFTLLVGKPVAFEATAGLLQLVDPGMLECQADAAEHEDAERANECQYYSHGMVTLYTPEDKVLATIVLDHEQPVAEIALPVAGEYVAFTHQSDSDVLLAQIVGASAAPQVHVLEMEMEEIEVAHDLFGDGEPALVELANIPLALQLEWSGVGALAHATLENANGPVASSDGFVVFGPSPVWHGTFLQPENFAKGEHTLRIDGLHEGTLTVTTLYYVRGTEVAADAVHAHAHGDAHEHEEAEEAEATETDEESAPEEEGFDLFRILDEIGV